MNRAERRMIKNQVGAKVKNEYVRDAVYMKGIQDATSAIMAVVALVSHDKLGFGQIRAKRLLDDIQIHFDCVQNDLVKLSEIKIQVKEKLDIDIK